MRQCSENIYEQFYSPVQADIYKFETVIGSANKIRLFDTTKHTKRFSSKIARKQLITPRATIYHLLPIETELVSV